MDTQFTVSGPMRTSSRQTGGRQRPEARVLLTLTKSTLVGAFPTTAAHGAKLAGPDPKQPSAAQTDFARSNQRVLRHFGHDKQQWSKLPRFPHGPSAADTDAQ